LLTENFSTQLDYTYDQTKLTSVNPLDINESVPPPHLGSALPGTPKNSLAASVVYQQDIGVGKFRWDVSAHYQSSLLPALSATVPTVGGYTMLETRLSYGWSHWLGTFYVTNLTNNLGISSYSDPAIYGNRSQAIVSQPRTFGVTLAYSFKEK
jgi:outer membrane receptor protein involved in Fe transport